jgi:tRNA threonylcarbamoyl adenosine modification protein YeaZ
MTRTLALDTTFGHLAIHLQEGPEVLAQHYALSRRRNASVLFGVLEELLEGAGVALKDLDALIVNQGPGSYTGVRISLSVVKTLAQVHRLPIVMVDALSLIAAQCQDAPPQTPVRLNCTRRELFEASFCWNQGYPELQSAPVLSAWELLSEEERTRPCLFHSITRRTDPVFAQQSLLPKDHPAPDGWLLTRLGLHQLNQHGPTPFEQVHPLYLKRDIESRTSTL